MRIVILAIHRVSVEKKLSLGFHYNNNEKKSKDTSHFLKPNAWRFLKIAK